MKNLILGIFTLALILAVLPAFAAAPRDMEVKYANGSFALRQSDTVNARVLAADTNENVSVPSYTDGASVTRYASYVLFSSTCNFYVRMGGAASVPAADVTDGSASELNPTMRFLGGNVTTFGIIAAETCVVTMNFYK